MHDYIYIKGMENETLQHLLSIGFDITEAVKIFTAKTKRSRNIQSNPDTTGHHQLYSAYNTKYNNNNSFH